MRIALIGGVVSTEVTLNKLLEYDLKPSVVYGFSPDDNSLVSGFVNLKELCSKNSVNYKPFVRVSSIEDEVASQKYDVVFVVGLSQLVSNNLLKSAVIGCVGFHPTKLPVGRGRAPIAWLVLDGIEGAATYFVMGEGADDGPILVQEPFEIEQDDYAKDVERKLLNASSVALDRWLPKLARGEWNPMPQNEALATYYGRRSPEDGKIDWAKSAHYIDRLIKASSAPHPGAYTYVDGKKIVIAYSRIETNLKIKGVVGRVLQAKPSGERLVQTGEGLIWIRGLEDSVSKTLRVGVKLGIDFEEVLVEMKKRIENLESKVVQF